MNKQLTKQAKIKRAGRQLGVKATGNPDDVLAVLLTATRLLVEGGRLLKDGWQETQARQKPTVYSLDGAIRRAVDLAHPQDRDSTLWAVQYVVDKAISSEAKFRDRAEFRGNVVLVKFNNHPDTTLEDAVKVLKDAAVAQGKMKKTVRKMQGR